eukprot:894286-Amphidinium_carterae.1
MAKYNEAISFVLWTYMGGSPSLGVATCKSRRSTLACRVYKHAEVVEKGHHNFELVWQAEILNKFM